MFLTAGLFDPEHATDLAQTCVVPAVAARATRIACVSGGAVTVRRTGRWELLHAVEQVVEGPGAAWTHVRPGEFAVNKLDVGGASIREEGVVRNAYPDGVDIPIHEEDTPKSRRSPCYRWLQRRGVPRLVRVYRVARLLHARRHPANGLCENSRHPALDHSAFERVRTRR